MAKRKKRSTEIEVGDRTSAWQQEVSQLPSQRLRGDEHFPGQEEGLDWRRYFSAAYRYKWLILLVTAAATGIGIMATLSLYRYEYQAGAKIWIEVENRVARNQGPVGSGVLLDSHSWIDLLETYAVLEEVVKERLLYLRFPSKHAQLFDSLTLRERVRPGAYRLEVDDSGDTVIVSTQDGVFVEHSSPGDSIGGEGIGLDWVPPAEALKPGLSIDFTVVTYRDAARRLKGRLAASMNRDGNFMTVRLAGSDPEKVATTLNAVVERYVDLTADIKRARLSELKGIIQEQRQIAQRNLAAAETALQTFRVATITLPSEPASPVTPGLNVTNDPVFKNFFEMKIESEELRRDRVELRRILASSAGSGVSIDAVEVVPSVRNSSGLVQLLQVLTDRRAELRALRTRYTDDHPDVSGLIDEIDDLESVSLPTALATLLSVVTAREAELQERIGSASRDLQRIPPRVIEGGRLDRAQAIAADLYTKLSRRHEEARLAEASSVPDVRILDRAVAPQSPIENQAPRFIFMIFAGSLGVSVLGAVLLDRSGRRVQYPVEVTRDMGLTILGSIPRVHRRNGKQDEHDLHRAHDLHQAIEALRGVRMNLMHAYGGPGPLVVTVTSPGSEEGKSFVTSNLAIAYAEAGLRTLIIDGDVRRGQLHRLFLTARKPGLTDFLCDTVPRERVVHETQYPLLSFISCGTRQQSAPDFLGSSAMRGLLDASREQFDVILVDSPPMTAGVDPLLLASVTGHLMLVLRTGTSDRRVAEAKLQELDRMPIRVLGAVLNDVRSTPVNRYYYEYSHYLPGYEARDESSAEEDASKLLPRPTS